MVSYSRVLPLPPPRYHAYGLDQRGHGDSERPDCCYTVEDFASDVVAFLDAVGAGRATLVGHSGSCLVARCVAEVLPERIARLVLIGAPGSLGDNEEGLELQTAVRGLQDPVPVEFVRELQGAAVHIPLPEPFFDGLIAESLKLPARVWKSTLDGLFAFDDAADLGRIVAPTLLIWGEWDRWLPREGCRRPRRLHARGVADPPPQDPLRGGSGRRIIDRECAKVPERFTGCSADPRDWVKECRVCSISQ